MSEKMYALGWNESTKFDDFISQLNFIGVDTTPSSWEEFLKMDCVQEMPNNDEFLVRISSKPNLGLVVKMENGVYSWSFVHFITEPPADPTDSSHIADPSAAKIFAEKIDRAQANNSERIEQVAVLHNMNSVWEISMSPTDRLAATINADSCSIILWNQHLVPFILSGHGDFSTSLAWSPDGLILASSNRDGAVHFWDAIKGEWLSTLHCDSWVSKINFIDNNTLIAVDDNHKYTWNFSSGKLLDKSPIPIGPHMAGVVYAAHPDEYAVVEGENNTLLVWKNATLVNQIGGHEGNINQFAIHNNWIATASDDATAALINIETGECRRVLMHEDAVEYVKFSLDGKRLVTADTGKVFIWDGLSGDQIGVITATDKITRIEFTPNNDLIVVLRGAEFQVWDLESRALKTTTGRQKRSVFSNWVFDTSGKRLFTISNQSNRILVWELPA